MNTVSFKKVVFMMLLFISVLFFSTTFFLRENKYSESISYRSKMVAEFTEGNYQVKIVTLPTTDGYGYEIYADGKLVLAQLRKPYLNQSSLFSSLNNAKIIAKYHAANLNSKDPVMLTIDVAKAKALGVSNEDLIINVNNNRFGSIK